MKKIVIIAVAVVILLVAAGGAAWFFFLRPSDEEEVEKELTYFEFELGEQYTNIKDEGEQTRKPILKYSPVIRYTDEKFRAEVEANKNYILTEMRKYFMNRTPEQLEQLDHVQEDLTDLVIQVLESNPEMIGEVLFTEFIVQ